MRKLILFFALSAFVIFPFNSCNDDDKENTQVLEYINPVENNPAISLYWLAKIRRETKSHVNEFYTQGEAILAYIEHYTLDEEEYYKVGYTISFINENWTIYDAEGNECMSLVGGDALAIKEGYEYLHDFDAKAIQKALLWEYQYMQN